MACALKIMYLANGEPSEFDGKFVAAYDPSFVELGGEYCGGHLELCEDPRNALQFQTVRGALDCWRQSYGVLSDGSPRRPLTAWNVLVTPVEKEERKIK